MVFAMEEASISKPRYARATQYHVDEHKHSIAEAPATDSRIIEVISQSNTFKYPRPQLQDEK